jgi:hypothetical protein
VSVVDDQRLEAGVLRGCFQRAELLALAGVRDDRGLGVRGQVDRLDRLQLLERGLEAGRFDFDVLPVVLQDDFGRGFRGRFPSDRDVANAGALFSSAGGIAAAVASALRRGGDRSPRDGYRHQKSNQEFHPLPPIHSSTKTVMPLYRFSARILPKFHYFPPDRSRT